MTSSRVIAGGSVVAALPFTELTFLGSPSIAVRGDGAYVVSHDFFGAASGSNRSDVYVSVDRGATWTRTAQIVGAFWSTLFEHRGDLYLLGTNSEYGALVIRRSSDGGETWSEPVDSSSGLLADDARFHTASVPVVEHDGRLWRAFEQRLAPGDSWGPFGAGVMSADTDSDLLDAANWKRTPVLDVPEDLREAGVRLWLEGNVVPSPDGGMVNVLRTDRWLDERQTAAVLRIDGGTAPLAPDHDALRPMPGGGSKFTIRWDDASSLYWSVVNTPMFDASSTLGLRARNTLSLAWSAGLQEWHVAQVMAHHPDDARHGFQYADWVVDGDDLIAAVRTAHRLDGGDAHSYHDSNLVTLHRIARFRELKDGD